MRCGQLWSASHNPCYYIVLIASPPHSCLWAGRGIADQQWTCLSAMAGSRLAAQQSLSFDHAKVGCHVFAFIFGYAIILLSCNPFCCCKSCFCLCSLCNYMCVLSLFRAYSALSTIQNSHFPTLFPIHLFLRGSVISLVAASPADRWLELWALGTDFFYNSSLMLRTF